MQQVIDLALALTHERTRYASSDRWREDLVLRLRNGLDGWMPGLPVTEFRGLSRRMHAEGWPPDRTPRSCGCLGCRIHHVLQSTS